MANRLNKQWRFPLQAMFDRSTTSQNIAQPAELLSNVHDNVTQARRKESLPVERNPCFGEGGYEK